MIVTQFVSPSAAPSVRPSLLISEARPPRRWAPTPAVLLLCAPRVEERQGAGVFLNLDDRGRLLMELSLTLQPVLLQVPRRLFKPQLMPQLPSKTLCAVQAYS